MALAHFLVRCDMRATASRLRPAWHWWIVRLVKQLSDYCRQLLLALRGLYDCVFTRKTCPAKGDSPKNIHLYLEIC
eukprot:1662702-Pleurochrysis_carterae.AAC.3